MKINEIHIYGFGKFKDYKLNFTDGFNLIYGENENGKTTIAEFIKMMFYGSKPRITDVFKNPRVKYKPLDNSTMAGSITFSHEGTYYRLEREFRNSNATDKITLHNLDLGEVTTLSGKDDIGAMFFSLNSGAFEKSVFVANSVTFGNDAEADGDINSRLSNMSNTGDEDISYEAVVKRITAAMEEIKTKTGRGGALIKLDAALNALSQETALQQEKAQRRDELEAEIEARSIACEDLANKKNICFERLKAAEKLEIKTKLEEFIKVATDYEELEKTITLKRGGTADKQFCDDLSGIIGKAEKIVERCDTLSLQISRITDEVAVLEQAAAERESTDSLTAQLQEANDTVDKLSLKKDALELDIMRMSEKTKRAWAKVNIPLIIIGVLTLILSVIGGLVVSNIIYAGVALGLVLIALSFVFKGKISQAQNENELALLEKQLANIKNEIDLVKQKSVELNQRITVLTVKSATGEELLGDKRKQIIAHRTDLLETQNQAAAITKQMHELSLQIRPVADIDGAKSLVKEVREKLEELSKLQVAAEYAAKGTNCKKLDEAKAKLAAVSATDSGEIVPLDAIREELKQITEEHSVAARELASLKAEARAAFSGLRVPAELEREKKELLEQKSEQSEYYDDLSLALDGLTAAFAEVRRSFSGVLEKRALEILSGITDGKYNGINVSKSFDITVSDRDNFGSHSLEYLSKGAMHQAYFSLRLALSELLGKDAGGLPVILDDAFSQYDDKRLYNALEFLKKYSSTSQVILFTCHNDCMRSAEKIGSNIINL